MQVAIHDTPRALGEEAAAQGADYIAQAIEAHGEANVIIATGASQFEMLESLLKADLDWTKVSFFHLDEYVGMPESHAASFRRYLRERFLDHLPGYASFLPVNGDAADLDSELAHLNAQLAGRRIDVCFAGIGENCHLAFNDPPANFDYSLPYLVVELDEGCRRQQFGEGWFENLEAVPARAISMSIRQIMSSEHLILSVPDERKAAAVKAVVEGPVTPHSPASIVQNHAEVVLHLDQASASLLSGAGQ